MIDRINDIAWQAHQGSVAAIIQVLNESLVISGVRTRAVFANGVLQLLCEASTVEQLEQSILVDKIHQILESIAPRNIRKVNINSRIVREEQLLWLAEISRDPENQLLWSQEIILSQPGIYQQLVQDIKNAYTEWGKPILPKAQSLLTQRHKHKNLTKNLRISLVILLLVLLLTGLLNASLDNIFKNIIKLQNLPSVNKGNEVKSDQTDGKKSTANSKNHRSDKFADAVRLANQASSAGKTATTSAQWFELAAKWQRASDLMSQVPLNHKRYQEARIRTKLYKEYSKSAEKEAEKSGS